MPELPEVETMVRGIRPVMDRAKILELRACPCDRKPLSISPIQPEFFERVRGCSIDSVERLAKRVVLRLSSDDVIVFEPRMTGLVLVSDPPSVEHLRFEFRLSLNKLRHSVWIWDRRGLGTFRLFTKEEFENALGGYALGPDALQISAKDLHHRLGKTQRSIKVALLDQKLVAGVGNLYASEILHEAKIHPQTVASKLSLKRVQRIHTAMNRILLEAITYEGSTLSDGTYRNALNHDGSYQSKHRVYSKEGTTCVSCNVSKIRRIVQTQRSTFFCPRCQRK